MRAAIQAQTISCIVWNSMIGRITMPAAAPGKRMRAMGAPLARLFTDPQNRMAARLSLASPGPASSQVTTGTTRHVAPMTTSRTHPAYQRYVTLNETECAVYGRYRYPE